MPTAQEWLAIVERLAATEKDIAVLEERVNELKRQLANGNSWIRLAIMGLITVVAAFAGAWAEHAARH